MPDDAELMAKWMAGDSTAGRRLFERHYRTVYRFFANKLGSLAEVEDLVQRTFMACFEARSRFRGEAGFRTFVLAIARNLLLKYFRDRRKVESIDASETSLVDCGLGASTMMGLRGEQRILLDALRRIPIDSQVVLELTYWEQMSAKQVAAVLEQSDTTIVGWLRKAKRQLREAIERAEASPAEITSTLGGLERWAEGLRGYWDAA